MSQTGVLLQIGCENGQVVVTNDRVYLRGSSRDTKDLWSVPRARVAGVQAHSGLILTDLAVRTCDGETYNASKVGASDALLAINLLGYLPERGANGTGNGNANGNGSAAHDEEQSFELVCGDARLSVSETEVEWTGHRPWRLLRKEIAGVSALMQSPYTELTVHTHSGRICRAWMVPVYGAVHVVELLGYNKGSSKANGAGSAQRGGSDAPRVRRTAPPTQPRTGKNTQATRRAVRTGSRRLAKPSLPPAHANGSAARRAGAPVGRPRRRSWLVGLFTRLHLRRA